MKEMEGVVNKSFSSSMIDRMFDQVNEKHEKSEDSLTVVDFEAMEEDNFFQQQC